MIHLSYLKDSAVNQIATCLRKSNINIDFSALSSKIKEKTYFPFNFQNLHCPPGKCNRTVKTANGADDNCFV